MTASDIVILLIGLCCTLALLATYVLYPLVVAVLSRLSGRPWHCDEQHMPAATMVVAAYNEEAVLEEKIRNFLSIDYPADKLTLLIGSDGSGDGSNALLERLSDGERVRAVFCERGGKMKTINRLVARVETPYIIFSDANTMYHPMSVRRLLRHFADDNIGGVCGKLILRPVNESSGGRGEHTYWSFENLIKQWEGNFATTLGATGGIYAIRREHFIPQPESGYVADDFLLPMRILANGKRFVFDGQAIAREDTMPDLRQEFRRKVRVAVSTFNAMRMLRREAVRYPLSVRLMLFAHKRLRWAAPFFLIGLLASVLLLSSLPWALYYLLVPVLAFCGLALLALIVESFGKRLGVLSLPLYFLSINAALLVGWYKFLFGPSETTWEPSAR
jgi:cellulose synthase/poly-beta-1,6-N-acetylglucosamine synthase-like glycosyltransferase